MAVEAQVGLSFGSSEGSAALPCGVSLEQALLWGLAGETGR